ncbi:unnamed protein product [Dimorphilus gyrociliatus]|uniref:RHD domain-containing protein n=1 Tax=Dimorphilus gyrociliatus TaxID=2664684 RepID=A0A7I8VXM0_9ANNE|nr:unnamed protein product [Dimorphilus gyrociliatus]
MIKAQPYVSFVEQPQERGYRFRYESEGATHGGIQGDNTKKSKKTYPSVQVHNFRGNVKVVVQLVTTDLQPILHPHKLVGKHCKYGFYVQDFQPNDKMTFTLQGLSIIHVTKKEVPELLAKRIEDDKIFKSEILRASDLSYEQPWSQEIDENTSKNIAMNAVKLKVSVYLTDAESGRIMTPNPFWAYSNIVHDSKCTNGTNLKITRIDKKEGCCTGGDEIFLLCEKVQKNDIEVRFYETNAQGELVWEDFGKFGVQDVHKQFAIVFRTPAYHDTKIIRDVTVFMQLRRKQEREASNSISFVYVPERSEMASIARKRAKRLPSSLNPSHPSHFPHQPDHSNNISQGRTFNGGEFPNIPDSMPKQNSGPMEYSYEHLLCTIFPEQVEQGWSPGPMNDALNEIDQLICNYMPSEESNGGDSGIDSSETPYESPLPDIGSFEGSDNFDIDNLKVDDLESDAAPASPHPIQSETSPKNRLRNICSTQLQFLKTLCPMNVDYETTLYVAVLCGELFIPSVAFLLKAGEKLSIRDERKNTPLHIAIRQRYSVNFIRILLQAQDISDCINSPNIDGQTPLHLAVSSNNLPVVEALICGGAKLNIENSKNGRTPLYLAVNNQYHEIVEVLVNHVDNVDLADGSGYTPLAVAVLNNDLKSANMLIQAGADPDELQDDGLPIILSDLSEKVEIYLNN